MDNNKEITDLPKISKTICPAIETKDNPKRNDDPAIEKEDYCKSKPHSEVVLLSYGL